MYTAVLWNPSIRKTVAIPFVLEPDSNVAVGFGVYTLSSRAWRSIPTINQPRNSIQLNPDQITIDEVMYWHAVDINTRIMTSEFHGYNMIVLFDMTSEKFMEISLPDTIACAPNRNVVISKLKESLVVIETVEEADKQVYGVWMMEHGVPNSFTKLFNINSPDASISSDLGRIMNL
ncbi:putative F-box associated interaction domain-containing protein [Helianthus annuus]|nr:putative F-box associated interaction domain-containing protein [Helianthus annuus]KAJ0727371.1 putative F-box associated interaction domain-containing protein [Helianthus annuus]KAJ0730168.1 putative F-box associated interaction domain-containing protein [Helianthus annuus]